MVTIETKHDSNFHQVKFSASSLNTNDCFVLVSPNETYVWLGKGSTGDEKEMAKRIALNTDKDPTVVYEGKLLILVLSII